MPNTIWVAQLRISDAIAHKISTQHGLQADEVRDAVECVPGLRYVGDDDPVRGWRAIIEIFIRGQKVLVVLYPVDDPMGSVFNLGSAYRIP
jgi:hypothetical protein